MHGRGHTLSVTHWKCGTLGFKSSDTYITAAPLFGPSMLAQHLRFCELSAHAQQPATGAWFGTFVAVLYLGFPLTVMSQLTTGPMLDVIAPKDKVRPKTHHSVFVTISSTLFLTKTLLHDMVAALHVTLSGSLLCRLDSSKD